MMNFNISKKALKGYFMKPQHFSVNDGEGIRTLVFLAGCPLRCIWCSNPESQIELCNNSQVYSEFIKEYNINEIVDEVIKYKTFYRYSGGGVTFSGGEPTLQLEMLKSLSEIFYDKAIDMAIETCGYFDFIKVEEVLDKMSTIFVDIKHMDSSKHIKLTGKDNKLILDNIKKMGEKDLKLIIRIPLIESINSDKENIINTVEFMKSYIKNPKLEFLPHHFYAEKKYEQLGIKAASKNLKAPSSIYISELKKLAMSYGIDVVKY